MMTRITEIWADTLGTHGIQNTLPDIKFRGDTLITGRVRVFSAERYLRSFSVGVNGALVIEYYEEGEEPKGVLTP